MKERHGVWALLVMTAVCQAMVWYSAGYKTCRKEIQNEAVKACVAEYVATPDGKVEFRWISQTEPHQPEE